MAYILRSTRSLFNLISFTRLAGDLVGKKNKFVFAACQKINFNQPVVRTFALSEKIKEEEQLNSIADFENEIYLLNLDIQRKRVLKENVLKVFEGLKQNGQMTSSQAISLLRCCTNISFQCSEKERIKMAEDIWSTAANLGVKFNENLYNALLVVFVQNNHQFSFEDFLKNMEEAGVEPSVVTYRHLLRASGQKGDIKSAKEFLEKIKSLNGSLSTHDFNSLILGHSKIGEFEMADEIFKVMKGKGIEPVSQSYTYLLCGYIENGKLEKFEEIFNKLYDDNIYLLDIDLLEIIYTLALNKQENHIDMVLNKLPKNSMLEKLLTNFIPRFLHKNLDSAVLKLLQIVDFQERSFNHAPYVSRIILDHFILYRSPNEILDMCQELETKGYANAAVPYCLKKVYFLKDEHFALSFIEKMNKQNLPVRVHYYWPILVKASKGGNKRMLSVMKQLPPALLNRTDFSFNIILPNYEFSESLAGDLEKLSHSGMNYENVARHVLDDLLKKNRLDEADELVAKYPVRLFRIKLVLQHLFKCLVNQPDKVEQVVNMLYNLYHDAYLDLNTAAKPDEKTPKHQMFIDYVITVLLNDVNEQEIVLRVLEAMAEKKFTVSPETGSLITKSLPDKNVEEIVRKLTDSNNQMELDKNLLYLKLKNMVNKSDKLQDLDSLEPLENCLISMLRLAKVKKFKKAMETGEQFAQEKKGSDENGSVSEISKTIYGHYLNELLNLNDTILLEKAVNLGKSLGVLSNDYDDKILYRAHIKSSNITSAFEKFKENLLTTGRVYLCEELLMKCFSAENTELVQLITELLTEAKGKDVALSHLVIALAATGEVDKTKKLLGNAGFRFQRVLLLRKLKFWYESDNVKILENITEVFKNLNKFDDVLTLLYKILVKKYAEKNKIGNINKLNLEIQNRNMDQQFLKQLLEFQGNSDVKSLLNSISIDFTTNRQPQQNLETSFSNEILESNDIQEEYLSGVDKNLPYKAALNLATKYALAGNIEEAHSIVEKYSLGKGVRKIATAFLQHKKLNEYFDFLDYFASKGDFIAISGCFRVGCLIPALKNDEELFKKYKSLTLQCADETHFSLPIISCFVTCVKLPGKLADAEEIFDKYSNYFKSLPFSKIKDAVEMTEFSSDFYENILSSKTLKDHFSDQIHLFYNRLITLKCEENKLDSALKYVDLAISDNVDKLLDKNSIELLKTKLKSKGKTFPYPELSTA